MAEMGEIPEPPQLRELMARQYDRLDAVATAKCVEHGHMRLTERPSGCELCHLDLVDYAERLERLNEWLNKWIDDAREILTRHTAALAMVTGWESNVRRLSQLETRYFFDDLQNEFGEGEIWELSRDGGDGEPPERLVYNLTGPQARALDQYLFRVGEIADGIVPVINLEGGEHGHR
jgi:hypothetical protein